MKNKSKKQENALKLQVKEFELKIQQMEEEKTQQNQAMNKQSNEVDSLKDQLDKSSKLLKEVKKKLVIGPSYNLSKKNERALHNFTDVKDATQRYSTLERESH